MTIRVEALSLVVVNLRNLDCRNPNDILRIPFWRPSMGWMYYLGYHFDSPKSEPLNCSAYKIPRRFHKADP